MLYYKFNGYEGFKELFGFNEHGNGVKSRRNKILLGLYKDRTILHEYVMGQTAWLNRKSLDDVKAYAIGMLDSIDLSKSHCVRLGDLVVAFSSQYSTDSMNGVCMDGDINSIRYARVDNGHIYKMKAGKFLRAIIDESGIYMPECIKTWLCETFTSEWRTYAAAHASKYQLHVDDDFERIYSEDECRGCFHSCMASRGFHTFYSDAVKAKAAYLTDGDGMVIARCVIYTEVYDQYDKVWRLAERQYSTDLNEDYKRMLVDQLIRNGHIDGYKRIGAGCGDANAFLDIEGNDLSDRRFRIECRLEDGDTVSYQDSFKWYYYDEQTAYNYPNGSDCSELDTTGGVLELNEGNWSNYHNRYLPEDDSQWVSTRDDYFWCDETCYCENIGEYAFDEDCVELANGDWAYYGYNCEGYEGVCKCPYCGEYYLEDDGYDSDVTDESYCSDSCRCVAEDDWYRDNDYVYTEYECEWIHPDDVIYAMKWNCFKKKYSEYTLSEDSFNDLVERGQATEYNDEFYIDAVGYDGEPVHACAA